MTFGPGHRIRFIFACNHVLFVALAKLSTTIIVSSRAFPLSSRRRPWKDTPETETADKLDEQSKSVGLHPSCMGKPCLYAENCPRYERHCVWNWLLASNLF